MYEGSKHNKICLRLLVGSISCYLTYILQKLCKTYKIDYASFLYLPTKKTRALKLERIQYQGIRLSLGYKITIPTNIFIDEAKIMKLSDRTKFLGCKYIL